MTVNKTDDVLFTRLTSGSAVEITAVFDTVPPSRYPEIKAVKEIVPDCPAESVPRFRDTLDHDSTAQGVVEAE